MTNITLTLLFIHLLKRVWKIGRVEWNIFGKSPLNFTFVQDNYLKSDWSKAVLFPISQDSRFINKFAWHFDSCDYSISSENPGALRTSKSFSRQEWMFFLLFHLLLSQRELFSMCQGSWIRFWTVRVTDRAC